MPAYSRKSSEEPKRDRRLELADHLIARIEQGTAPWQKPWVAREVEAPRNAISGKPYRGVNHEMLMAFSPDPTDPRWCTYKQAEEQGWQVRKGEHAAAYVEKYSDYERKPTEEEIAERLAQGVEDPYAKVKAFSVRHYPVFHASQIHGIPPLEREPLPEIEGKPDERLPKLVEAMGVSFAQSGGRAYYRLDTDHVQMPDVASFAKASGYDTTLLHELSHATMHESRLDRGVERDGFGGPAYAKEELRAEMSAAMTAMHLGIGHDPDSVSVEDGRENSAAYLAGWLKALPEKDRKQILMDAIRDVQQMSDYLIERTPEIDRERVAEKGPVVETPTQEAVSRGIPEEVAPFLGRRQAQATSYLLRIGEEREFFSDKMRELAGIVQSMPETYGTDGVPDAERPVSLRYFGSGNQQWFIIEKDRGNPLENDFRQTQAFGLADLGMGEPEMGYISIEEITRLGAELDYHFTPTTLLEVKKQRYPELLQADEISEPEMNTPPLDQALTALENHTITLRTPDGEKAVNARRYLDIGIEKHGMTAIDEKNGAVLWKNPETGKEKTITDEKLSAVLRSASRVDKDIGRAIASVEKKQSAELEI